MRAAPVIVLFVALAPAPSQAARSDFTGAKACGKCHQKILASWKKTAHATATSTLGRRVSNRACSACHTTGDAPMGKPYFSGVQCEACHGPGAGYSPSDVMRSPALARRLGLRDLSTPALRAALCSRCHRATTKLAPFDPEAAWKRIAH